VPSATTRPRITFVQPAAKSRPPRRWAARLPTRSPKNRPSGLSCSALSKVVNSSSISATGAVFTPLRQRRERNAVQRAASQSKETLYIWEIREAEQATATPDASRVIERG
jgi:hypothetical protein